MGADEVPEETRQLRRRGPAGRHLPIAIMLLRGHVYPRRTIHRRPSRAMLVAAELVRRGDDLVRVSEVTRVPLALLELIDAEIARFPDGLQPGQHVLRGGRRRTATATVITALWSRWLMATRRPARRPATGASRPGPSGTC